MQAFDLSKKIALVTGGNGGIGLGRARGLARAGAGVAVFLASAASDFVTGAAITVDSGYSVRA